MIDETIFADKGYRKVGGFKIGVWSDTPHKEGSYKYIRADKHQAALDALREAREALEKAIDWWDGDERHTETMQTIRNDMRRAIATVNKVIGDKDE